MPRTISDARPHSRGILFNGPSTGVPIAIPEIQLNCGPKLSTVYLRVTKNIVVNSRGKGNDTTSGWGGRCKFRNILIIEIHANFRSDCNTLAAERRNKREFTECSPSTVEASEIVVYIFVCFSFLFVWSILYSTRTVQHKFYFNSRTVHVTKSVSRTCHFGFPVTFSFESSLANCQINTVTHIKHHAQKKSRKEAQLENFMSSNLRYSTKKLEHVNDLNN